jgi:PadR family transcriptional regulator AphA
MSLKYAILGFIGRIPVSGYDLKKMFQASVSPYWPATHSQIYRTLEEIHRDGLVSERLVAQQNHRNKKVFEITEKGRQALYDWVNTPAKLPDLRHELLVKLSYADILKDEDIRRILEDYKEKVQERLTTYLKSNQGMIDAYATNERERFLWQICLDSGIRYCRNELIWLEEAIKRFSRPTI